MNRRNINTIINRVLPVSSRLIGSPRNRSGMESYCKAFSDGTTFKCLDIQQEASYTIPGFFSPRNIRHSYAFFVANLQSGRVWGRNGAVISDRDYFISDVSREFDEGRNVEHSVFYTIRQVKPSILKGKSAVIGTAGSYVYYHWMLDVLPRLKLLSMVTSLQDVDHFVTEFNGFHFQKETLERLGIPESKIVASNENWNFHAVAETLYVPSLVGPIGQPTLFQVNFLRELYREEMFRGKGFRKVYVSRRRTGRRLIINEEEVVRYLLELGFEIIDCEEMPLSEQVKIFSEAAVVIGSHGSAFTNLVFCNSGTRVLDIFNSTHTNPCFWIIANMLGLDYYYLPGKSVPMDGNPKSDNTEVDVELFLAMVNKMCIP